MSLQAYLAQRYMSGPKADAILARSTAPDESGEPRRKKRKVRRRDEGTFAIASEGGIGVVDEDDVGLIRGPEEDEAEGDVPVVADAPKQFRAKKTGWVRPGAGAGAGRGGEERGSTREEDATPPPPASTDAIAPPPKKRGGLLTASDLALEVAHQRAAAAAAATTAAATSASDNPADAAPTVNPHETIHRDRTGAIIDTQALAAAERSRVAAEEKKARDKLQWNRGVVQRAQEDQERKREQGMKREDVARYADDRGMNDELRAREREDDPAAAFLTKRKPKGPQRPKYSGPPAPPNRFNILPGYRWDGVDRSTGFEAKLFQAMNNRRRRAVEANAWSMEDM